MTAQTLKNRRDGFTIGLAPTLGFLHEGHRALIKRARKENDRVAVSLFVNPLQFRARAYRDYPRDEKRDLAICREEGVDYVLAPPPERMYPQGFETRVETRDLPGRLEGASIRWHYRGVTTVVAKLFNIVQPHRAYFGRKDPHQLAIIRWMVKDMNFPVKIVDVATKRDKDGVALSSRNSLLNTKERQALVALPRALKMIEAQLRQGATDRAALSKSLARMLAAEQMVEVEFAAVVDAETLLEDRFGKRTLIYAAIRIGGKRLTDNRVVRA